MNKKIAVGVVGLAVVAGIAGVAASTTYARGGMTLRHAQGELRGNGTVGNATSTAALAAQREVMEAHHAAVNKAVAAGDYAAWKAAMSTLPANGRGGDMTTVITEANFPRFAEMHRLMTQADAIRTELGLTDMGPGMHGRGKGMMQQVQSATQ